MFKKILNSIFQNFASKMKNIKYTITLSMIQNLKISLKLNIRCLSAT